MLKFIRGKGQQPSAERQKLQKELFAYRKTAQHGFPHKPSAIAYDPKMKLMAIGTHTGTIKVFGKPGVEFYGQHTPSSSSSSGTVNECNVQLLEWVSGTGRVLSLTAANQLILWEPAGSMLVPIKTLPFDGKLKKVSSLCCSLEKDIVWIGTEGGNVYQFDLKTFTVKDPVIYHDNVLEQVPPTYKLNPGAIESIKQLPTDHNRLLIAYNRGLCVLYDLETSSVVRSYIAPGHGQSVGLHVSPDGHTFTWYHADGSFATWDINKSDPPKDQNYVPYGPDPCKSINGLIKGKRGFKDIVIFSGGMPRSAYGDHSCVSVHCSDNTKICLDFTSKVIDFFVTFKETDPNQVEVLIVLLEEELCAYDLTDKDLPPIKLPYLHSVHTHAVTCNYLASQVKDDVYKKIVKAGLEQETEFSDIEWPITGGYLVDESIEDKIKEHEVLLTGHEDGSVKFWDCTGVVLKPIYHFKTSVLFGHGDDDDLDHPIENTEPLDDSEPPFRKAGLFDPYSDDPRLAIKKIALCPKTGQLIVAGTAGHIVIATFDLGLHEDTIKVNTMNLVSDRDGFVWKGHDKLTIRSNLLEENGSGNEQNGVQVTGILQVLPPAAITCLALQTNWNLLAAGTAHGLVLYDYENHHPVYYRCTLNPNDLTGAGETLSRRKSFKKTLRESFRRLRKGRSTRNNPAHATQAATIDTRPIERQVEARSVDDGMGSMVKCLVFARTFITNANTTTPTLWSATNASCVSIFLLNVPPTSDTNNSNETKRMITAQLAKEIQLKHRAPVVGISIFDHTGVPLELNGPGTHPHRVVIASEEQFKVFSLPQLKPITKYKLTAHEGARVRKLATSIFSCQIPSELIHAVNEHSPSKSQHKQQQHQTTTTTENTDGIANTSSSGTDVVPGSDAQIHTEIGLLCLTNLGDVLVLSIPELKRQLNAAAVRREDINGISSLCFTNYGEALYMMSSSELQRISLSTARVITPEGAVDLEPLQQDNKVDAEELDNTEQQQTEINETAISNENLNKITKEINKPLEVMIDSTIAGNTAVAVKDNLTNGLDTSPNRANETITSSIGDITIDSVRDHLNATTTTLCSTTTEETVGRLSVLSTQTNNVITTVNMKDITDYSIPVLKDLAPLGKTTETNTSSVVIKSVITSISHGQTNGEPETVTTSSSTTRKESQF